MYRVETDTRYLVRTEGVPLVRCLGLIFHFMKKRRMKGKADFRTTRTQIVENLNNKDFFSCYQSRTNQTADSNPFAVMLIFYYFM